ncbi:MFS transporter [Rummeliibacillus stabekisii]|uniref:MFS transporter n=1 Tax=Rummeliibacillus stabekisii TaxID=241244 RepID=UPI00203F89AD|nr:MFS transporter [Rummeliibacillus stabekisii]MCM3317126.1 MFS transporter [Rummeliibacillus stabekisii]
MTINKNYLLLLSGFGISNLGNWIYLIALNLSVWHLTHSPAAVSGLFIVGPVARIFCNFFAGTFIDRHNKRLIIIWSDIVRGIIVCLMPFAQSVWLIYLFIAIANSASCFFAPNSTFLIAKLVNDKDKQRFNAINSTISSGSFMLGPALAGVIIGATNTSVAMWINGISFFICAWLIFLLPNTEHVRDEERERITVHLIWKDFKHVWEYCRKKLPYLLFFIFYSLALMIAFALDSQEMTFIKQYLLASDSQYGITVTMAGVGAILGGGMAAAAAKRFSYSLYIGCGLTLTLFSYFSFYSSHSIRFAVISLMLLGFCMAFSNTGYDTFFQKTIPTNLMGRFSSTLSLVQSILQITFTFCIGMLAEWWTVQAVALIFSSIGIMLALSLFFIILRNTSHFAFEKQI